MRDFFLHTVDLLLKGGAAAVGFLVGMTSLERRWAVLLLLLMAADCILGIIAAVKDGRHGKRIAAAGAKNALSKSAMLLILMLAYAMDWLVHEGNAMFFTAVCWFGLCSESLSLLKNLTLCGFPMPRIARVLAKQLAYAEPEA